MLANDLMNTVEIRVGSYILKAVIKYQRKHLPRNVSTFLHASAINKSSDDINCGTIK